MALSNSFIVKFYYYGILIDFSSRCTEFSTTVSAPVGVFGSSEATIRLLNNDGALTPNGGGTYQSVDWFNYGAYIENSVYDIAMEGYYPNEQIFSGVISRFNLYDDGRESYVEITAVDAFGKLSQTGEVGYPAFTSESTTDMFSQMLSNPYARTTGLPGTNVFQPSGYTYSGGYAINAQASTGTDDPFIENFAAQTYPSFLSILSDGLLNSVNGVAYPTDVTLNDTSSTISYRCLYLGNVKTRADDYREYKFDQYFTQSSSLTYGELPFSDLQQEFENESLVNRVTAIGSYSGATQEQSDSTLSQGKYGIRAINKATLLAVKKNVTINNTASGSITAQGELTDVKSRCHELVQRYFSSSFTPASLSLTFGQVKSSSIESRINLVKNPSFFTDTSYWSSGQTLTRDTSLLGYLSFESGKIIWSLNSASLANTTMNIPSTGTYVFSIYVYVAPASPLIGRTVSVANTGGTATVSSSSSATAVLVGGTWVRTTLTQTFTTTGTNTVEVQISGAYSAGAQINIDAGLMEKGSTVQTYWTPIGDEYEPKLLGGAFQWKMLLSAQYALWQKATILWTGKGAASQSQDLMIVKRTINANPTDVEVTLELQPYYDNHSFQLGVDKLSQGKVA
jgi:hypothetical protein